LEIAERRFYRHGCVPGPHVQSDGPRKSRTVPRDSDDREHVPASRRKARTVQMWSSIGFSDAELVNHGSNYLHVIARLKPGVSLKAANANLGVIARNLQKQFPDSNAKEGAFAVPLRDRLASN